jgi:hypothetical protein
MGDSSIRLDGAIRNWVLIPITVAMFLVGVVRHNVAKLLRKDVKVDLPALREAQAVIRAERVRNNAGYLSSAGFRQRRHFFCDKVRAAGRPSPTIATPSARRRRTRGAVARSNGSVPRLALFLARIVPSPDPSKNTPPLPPGARSRTDRTIPQPPSPPRARTSPQETGVFSKGSKKMNQQQKLLSDPTMMTDMLKKNMNMVVPQMLTAAWVNFFFTGFVVGKVPFPLTQRFRGMLQRGIELQSLDVTYVSSLSWYFLNFFGLRGVFALTLGKNELDDAQAMQQQMAMGMDTTKAFAAVKEGIDMLQHEFMLHVAERRAGRLLRRLKEGAPVGRPRA